MLCYKDRSFCCHFECENVDCYKFCSEETKLDAIEFGLPIAYISMPQCPLFEQDSWERLVRNKK